MVICISIVLNILVLLLYLARSKYFSLTSGTMAMVVLDVYFSFEKEFLQRYPKTRLDLLVWWDLPMKLCEEFTPGYPLEYFWDVFVCLWHWFHLAMIDKQLENLKVIGKAGKIIRLISIMHQLRLLNLAQHINEIKSLFYVMKRAPSELGLLQIIVLITWSLLLVLSMWRRMLVWTTTVSSG